MYVQGIYCNLILNRLRFTLAMKIALVHDDLVQWGGAEKVLGAISDMYPDAPIFTSVFDESNPLLRARFKGKRIITSFIQKIPGWRSFYRPLLPLYPLAFESFDFSEYDLVISQTTKFAKSIITKPETLHLCIIHTPPRFLWHLPSDKTSYWLQPFLSCLRVYDQISATRVDHFIAGSYNAQQRVQKIYHTDASVLQPFVDQSLSKMVTPFDGGYYLLIARFNQYKNVHLVVKAFNENGKILKIVGSGPQAGYLKSLAKRNISFYERVSDLALASLLAGCKGLVVAAEEDFGMTALEAQSFGKGVIAYGFGGAKETVLPGKTGVYFKELNVASLQQALEMYETIDIDPSACHKQADAFSLAKFESKLKNIIDKLVSRQ
jgi:glycosyltransferase involved in cell wall biosynthesis